MARQKKSKTRKIQPAEMTIATAITVPAATTDSYTADLSQMASIVNRRFYRQGLNWAVGGFKVRIVGTGQGTVAISKLPSTWTFANSWTKGFRTWQEMNKQASDEAPSVEGRFLDFKIYADSTHHTDGYGNNLLPIDENSVGITGEWIPSEVVVPDSLFPSVGYELIGVGANFPGAGASGKNAVSLVQGYANSRGLPQVSDPNSPAESDDADGQFPENWMSALSNEGITQTSEVLEDIRAYDQPPYPYENDGTHTSTMYPGGSTQLPNLMNHDVTDLTATTISGTSRLKGGNFPCGLVRFNIVNPGATPLSIVILMDMVPGHHRGYLAESMTEM